jgi:hypothetical protein
MRGAQRDALTLGAALSTVDSYWRKDSFGELETGNGWRYRKIIGSREQVFSDLWVSNRGRRPKPSVSFFCKGEEAGMKRSLETPFLNQMLPIS